MIKRLCLIEEHAREKCGAGETWRMFRWECFPHGGEPIYQSVTGAVCEHHFLRGPRKGQTNWQKRDARTEQTVNITVVDHDKWVKDWQSRTGKCSECVGTGEVFKRWSLKTGTEFSQCHKCKGTGKP